MTNQYLRGLHFWILTLIVILNHGFLTCDDVLESATWTSCDLVTLNENGIGGGLRL